MPMLSGAGRNAQDQGNLSFLDDQPRYGYVGRNKAWIGMELARGRRHPERDKDEVNFQATQLQHDTA
jgi:hypothetical protein